MLGGDVRVVGNVALNTEGTGFLFLATSNDRIVAIHNLATGNGFGGFIARGISGRGFVVLDGNTPIGNPGVGFQILDAAPHVVMNNRSSGNGGGFALNGAEYTLLRNTVTANLGDGIVIVGGGHMLSGNSVIGNAGVGLEFLEGSDSVVHGNNIYGNDPQHNCGLVSLRGGVVDGTGNYWGAPTGPGPGSSGQCWPQLRGEPCYEAFCYEGVPDQLNT